MNYNIDLSSHITIQVEAESVHEAIKKAEEQNPKYSSEFILDEWENGLSVDHCDGCGKPIIEGDYHTSNHEQGNSYCTDCSEAIADDKTEVEAQP